MTAYHTETVDTPAGQYTIELHYDDDGSTPNPLVDWDQEGMAFYIAGSRDDVLLDTLPDASAAGNAVKTWIDEFNSIDDIERRFALWRAITGNPWILVTGHDFDAYQSWGWLVLVDTSATYVASDGKSYPSLPEPENTARLTMESYRKWASGEVCGFVTLDPSGNDVDSCWGFYDEDEAIAEARDIAEWNAEQRTEKSNLVGAGFVGIV